MRSTVAQPVAEGGASGVVALDDETGAGAGVPVVIRASTRSEEASASIDRSFGPHSRAGIEVLGSGPRSDVGAIRLPGYALVNLRASWLLSGQWRLAARIENLTDRDYELAYGYNTPGRSAFVEIVWSME